jgi:hypothetical protein
MAIGLFPSDALGTTVVQWDFAEGTRGWKANRRVENLTSTPLGLLIQSTGLDPWVESPAIDLPSDAMTRVTVRMKSSADQAGELFYGETFRAGRSVRFRVQNDGQWHDYALVIRDKLGADTRFRLDPCAGAGEVTVASIKVEAIQEIAVPCLEKPRMPRSTDGSPVAVKSGCLEFRHYGGGCGNFAVEVDGSEMAGGYQSELIGLVFEEETQWLHLEKAQFDLQVRSEENELESRAVIEDSRGAKWELIRRVTSGAVPGTLTLTTQITVDQDRAVIRLPLLTLFPGLGTFGQKKYQGLFAGLEYLCDEPSSSQADITTPEHVRRLPDPVKMTFPLMAIAQGGRYFGVIWEPSDMVAATFDSPDRIYDSYAHVMALSAPAVGDLRFENEFCAHTPFRLRANKPLKVSMLLIGGKGKTVVPAVKQYVALKGLPELPQFEGGFGSAVNLLSHGWLDSQINEDGLFRHAVWGESFGAGPAADAAMFMDWLTLHSEDEKLVQRLERAIDQALGRIPPRQPFSSAVSHAHLPTAPFVFGRLDAFVRHRHNEAKHLLRNFDQNGIKAYRPGDTDYSKTHFATHTNGYAGRDMVRILEGAVLSADRELIADALKLLDKQTALYGETVPRGAQTWEVPLHTPDILASAHLVKAYTLGHIISGDNKYLEQARYWAWTGVPFVYLCRPTDGEVGLYATIPVLGATNWQAPVWLGRPVQWCGLVYGSALHLLAEYDRAGPWQRLANGITAAGLQMCWSRQDRERQGLLPDFFDLNVQVGAGPAINPGTVQAHVPELYELGTLYDVKKLPPSGWFIHAPCLVHGISETNDEVVFTGDGWGDKECSLLVSGVENEPDEVCLRKTGKRSPARSDWRVAQKTFYESSKLLVITFQGPSQVRIR